MDTQTKHELALALLVWKNFRQVKRTTPIDNVEIADHILDLAKQLGIRDEFLALMMIVPIMTIRIEELEKWISPGYFQLPEELIPTTNGSNTNSKRRKAKGINHNGILKIPRKPKL